MKYLAFLGVLILLLTHEDCGSKGVVWTFDGHSHAFVWKGAK